MARLYRAQVFDVQALRASLEQGEYDPVYALNGEDAFFRMDALRALREKVLGDADPNLCLSEYDTAPDPAEVFERLRTPGLFSASRMVIVDPADQFVSRSAEALARYAASPSSGACLVLAVERWRPKAALKKLPAGAIRVVSCAPLRGSAVTGWVTMRARTYGKRLDSGAARLMIEIAGDTLATLDRHLQNLAAFAGGRGNISCEDVAELVGGDPQRAAWELTSAVVGGRAPRALTVLRQLLLHGAEPIWLIAALAGEFTRLWRVKRMMREGRSDSEIVEAVGVSAGRLRHVKEEADGMSPRRLLSAHRALLDFDLAAKQSAMPRELLLECLTLSLCGDGRFHFTFR